ncbi:MAG: crossover junction endodeoxyribonuclease RuvC [Candidatus Wallbacteria bacterium]|nr:crossover junction endodeoxyribonuclease RuvC [Candidatus Wallbacteria bacterium]
MVVLGIDPGLATLGYAVIGERSGGFLLHESGVVRTAPELPFPYRLKEIFVKLESIGSKHGVGEMACESLFFTRNAKTCINVAHARGVVVLLSALRNIRFFEYTPTKVKSTLTGYGKADKKQMQKMMKLLLNLERVPAVDDEADAMALAICHLQHRRFAECSGM